MYFSDKFICYKEDFSSYKHFVPAPYFRKSFNIENDISELAITICGLGFYRLWINGKEITKGIIAPYVSNPDDIKYYDTYDITHLVNKGENVLGIQLGNGMLNNPGGEIWDFEKADFRRSPLVAFSVEGTYTDGNNIFLEADEGVKCTDSPLYFDDYRSGERYDATKEIKGWNTVSFDDVFWDNAHFTKAPKGVSKLCEAEPVKPTGEVLRAVSITHGTMAQDYIIHKKMAYIKLCELTGVQEGYIYDFGVNKAGVPLLKIKGKKGQRIELQFGEYLTENGELTYRNINFYPDEYSQRDVFICSGEEDCFMPYFTYHGARYCIVTGITEEQATADLLSFVVCNSALTDTASFTCSDETTNKLYDMCKVSDLANFFYFPTDCPHREKNGWTGDIALSAEHMAMMYSCEKSFSEWLNNARASQKENGEFCAIIPTTGWGFGFGPSWDAFLANVCYYIYKYKGNRKILEDNADALYKYILWAEGTVDSKGLVKRGLGDWCPVGGNSKMKASAEFTSNVNFIDTLNKSSFIFEILGRTNEKEYAEKLCSSIRKAVRREFIDETTLVADTCCQTSQAMAIYFDIFEESEKEKAFEILLDIIHKNGDFPDSGILGARILYHLLCDNGKENLAYKMITRPEWPSYGHFITQGLTSIPESFFPDFKECDSLNHHFFGDIANLFISKVAGIRYNVDGKSFDTVEIKPCIIENLSFASASLITPAGEIKTHWERTEDGIKISVEADKRLKVYVLNGENVIGLGSGEFFI